MGTGKPPSNQADATNVNAGSSSNAVNPANPGTASSTGFAGIFGGAVSVLPPPAIAYSSLTPDQVKSDPYLIPIYNALMPKLPQSITSLQIRSIERGTFSNGTIGYQIYYGSASATTCFLTIFFDPPKSQVIYLTLTNATTASGSPSERETNSQTPSTASIDSSGVSSSSSFYSSRPA